jgi:hypothetical protein
MPWVAMQFRSLDRLAPHLSLTRGCIFIVAFALFLAVDPRPLGDTAYSMLVSHSLFDRGRLDLNPYFAEPLQPLDPSLHPGMMGGRVPHTIHRIGGHLYYYFPPGTSVLSVPFVFMLNAVGLSVVDQDGRYAWRAERRIQRLLAAALMAAFTVLMFELARLMLPLRWSLVFACVSAFGSPVWSTASRAMWSHTWAIFLLGAAAYMLLAEAVGRRRCHGPLLGTLLAWAYFTRPTSSIPAVAIGVYLLLRLRSEFPGYVGAFVGWGLGFVAASWFHFGSVLPPYFLAERLGSNTFWTALVGNLISPARGLFVFMPSLILVFALLFRYRSRVEHRGLLVLSGSICLLHWIVVSTFPHWWAGHSYGPRLMTDILPWLAIAAVLGTHAWLATTGEEPSPARAGQWIAASLIAVSVLIHGAGAISDRAHKWNALPVNVDSAPERIWDWRNPQVLTWLLPVSGPPAPLEKKLSQTDQENR